MNEIDWSDILDSFEADSCVLFIGPYAFRNEQGQSIDEALFNYLELEKVATEKHRRIKRYYQKEGLFFLKREGYQNKIANQIKEFYTEGFEPNTELLKKIAEIPFSLVVNLTPDKFLKDTYESPEVQLPFFHDFYDKSGAIPNEYIETNAAKPLIYNLLGYINKEESLILTHDNLFDYLESFFAKNTMHGDLKTYIQNAHAYIFLGLPIDKWYTQLLLRILKLNKKSSKELERLSSTNNELNPIIFKDQFHLKITTRTVDDFINELHEVCAEEDLLKKIKTGKKKPVFDLLTIKTLIEEAEIEEAMKNLEEILCYHQPKSNDLLQSFRLLKNRFSELDSNNRLGVVMDYDTKKMIFVKDFLAFLNDDVEIQIDDILL